MGLDQPFLDSSINPTAKILLTSSEAISGLHGFCMAWYLPRHGFSDYVMLNDIGSTWRVREHITVALQKFSGLLFLDLDRVSPTVCDFRCGFGLATGDSLSCQCLIKYTCISFTVSVFFYQTDLIIHTTNLFNHFKRTLQLWQQFAFPLWALVPVQGLLCPF